MGNTKESPKEKFAADALEVTDRAGLKSANVFFPSYLRIMGICFAQFHRGSPRRVALCHARFYGVFPAEAVSVAFV
jgi:hypothetical protein